MLSAVGASAPPALVPATPPAAADEFLVGLQAPIPLKNVRARLEHDGGIELEIDYDLQDIGHVSVALHGAEDGSGLGVVTIANAVVGEVEFAGGEVVWERTDLSALEPAQAQVVGASILQVWDDEHVTEALGLVPPDDRDLKCSVASGLAGGTAAVMVASICGVFLKAPSCLGAGYGTFHKVSGYIADKCNGAQNK
ncbi:hypothetical protein [Nannocystis punicea]|uniref:Uncharacterized protein n=1 Tax=Nannocystis punicea TaxID=2995304 RepID=A0ABY7H8E4_9BACT|nr:hypothetical protein [Nannocystis poenicansa]WAS95365.1 hypothetical protein O0S08_04325 [Nannocystis poenicansa]